MSNPPSVLDEVTTGTTIMGVVYNGGVVLGADSRTSMGSYVANRVSDKITQVSDHILICRSGSAADTQAIADYVQYFLDHYSSETGRQPLVKIASHMARNIIYEYKDHLQAALIVGGVDENGPSVYSIPLGGALVKQPVAIGGSGSSYIYGYVDANYRENMSRDEAVDLVTRSVALAMSRDGSSGGIIRIAVITEDSVERFLLSGREVPRFGDY
ncbi:hypothetical protein RCL1_000240 [Eukaryota sp. TZLM3-RCL]